MMKLKLLALLWWLPSYVLAYIFFMVVFSILVFAGGILSLLFEDPAFTDSLDEGATDIWRTMKGVTGFIWVEDTLWVQ